MLIPRNAQILIQLELNYVETKGVGIYYAENPKLLFQIKEKIRDYQMG